MQTRSENFSIPKEFICQLTGQMFLDPVMLPNNVAVEREFIEKWINDKGNNPFTRNPLIKSQLRPASRLLERINLFISSITNSDDLESVRQNQYVKQGEQIRSEPQSRSGVGPDADDMLAIDQARGGSSMESPLSSTEIILRGLGNLNLAYITNAASSTSNAASSEARSTNRWFNHNAGIGFIQSESPQYYVMGRSSSFRI